MTDFRIEREKYLTTTLRGIGASMAKGYRWNSLHTKLVYTSESRALATLEVSVHLDLSEDLPSDRFYVEVDIPDDITIMEVNIEDLPADWEAKPPALTTQIIVDDFVHENDAAVLKVPSSIVHQEFNYLINPNHPDSKKISVRDVIPMTFDARLNRQKN